jgi:cell division protein FtsB
MNVRVQRHTTSTAQLVKPLMLMLFVFYFGYHALHGERGLYALVREQRELAQLTKEYDATKAAREKMELKVSHLRDGSVDKDLLDEQMRRMLGVMDKNEVVILTDKKKD